MATGLNAPGYGEIVSDLTPKKKSIKQLSPVVLFVYNRPEHTKQTIDSLKANYLASRTNLYIFSDGPKNEGSIDSVNKVRDIIRNVEGFKSVAIVERNRNLGLAESIITGVTEIINKYGKIIVMEDDLLSAPNFLSFMNGALDLYKDEPKVFSLTGHSYTNNMDVRGIPNTYFLKITSSWSWATWDNKWRFFDRNATGWGELNNSKSLRKKFNYDNSYNYSTMMNLQMQCKINSWAIRWYWSVFKQDGLTLYPRETIIENIGFDGSGVHCGNVCNNIVLNYKEYDFDYTKNIFEELAVRKKIVKIIKNNTSLYRKITQKFYGLFRLCNE